ncbi:Uncharacterized protein TPAR_02968 [Tolypocladium paradoxum]|uniref:Xylanolytic transcriptional activator regulatory domain-containing protein n=1 Tax=Tolypocladium paradoxum TaxID=94208 RepID=A0A2S4L309_9HYPO|nr:Uncharacterized protein TPAR_02968 [Tolypocladium paradoxum]
MGDFFITENDLQPPSMKEEEQEALMRVFSHLRINHPLFSKDLAFDPASNNKPSNPHSLPFNESNMPGSDSTVQEPGSDQLKRGPRAMSQAIFIDVEKESGAASDWQRASNPPSPSDFDIAGQSTQMDFVDGSDSDVPLSLTLPLSNWPWADFEDPRSSIQASLLAGGDASYSMLPSTATIGNPSGCAQALSCTSHWEDGAREDDNTESLLDQLSNRIGSLQIGPGGQVRYYGPTSNFNLVDMPAPDNLTVHRTVRNDGQEYLDRLGIGKEVPHELEEHLTDLYFAWQDPTFHAVDRAMFESARISWRQNKEDTPYYSEALQNSICSLGAAFEARYHKTFTTFPKSLSDFFADRAKALLEIELDSPCVATVQAMMVLSSHDIGCKRDARGWLYSGMAMRLAFDLALHVDMTPYVANKALTQREADVRRDVFWGVYVIDHMWGFSLGRPFRINMEDVTVAKPLGRTTPQSTVQWIPYVSRKSTQDNTTLPDYTEELHRQRVLLVEIMAPLGYALYGSLRIPPSTLQAVNAKTVAKLVDWKASLPSVLHVDLDDHEANYLPHVILLHMQYHQNLIHAHRPWMSRTYIQPNPPQGPGSNHARMTCIESAFSIARLIQLYERRYALRRMNIQGVGITCSAALLLIFATVSHYQFPAHHDLTPQLSACFRALDEFSASWESAKRAREFLLLLQRRWERQGQSARVRRASQAMPANSTPTKRHRTESLDGPRESQLQTGISPSQPRSELFVGSDSGGYDMSFDLEWIFTGDACLLPRKI